MTSDINRQWRLAVRPHGMVDNSSFSYHETARPLPSDDEFLIRTLYVSVDPAMRGWLTEDPGYIPALPIGSVMHGSAIGQVVESRHDDFQVGNFVTGGLGWQDFCLSNGGQMTPVQKFRPVHPLPVYLSTLGGTGLTAYFGMLDVAKPKDGETVVVSGAAGATGSVAAQIARIKQCRVIGLAGGPDKCQWLTNDLGLHGAINYKDENLNDRLGDLCPNGIDIYFDNVGGRTLETVIEHMTTWGRIASCGMISTYNEEHLQPGPKNLFQLIKKRIRMEGFLVPDYSSRFKDAKRELSGWLATGALVSREDIRKGFENIPSTFIELFSGTNLGKLMVKLSDPAVQET